MLTQLSTVKARLGISEFDLQYDNILTNAIKGVSARFDKECNRTLARTADAAEEFSAADMEVCPGCYPIESVSSFALKTSEAGGWVEQTGMDFLVRRRCVISLAEPLGNVWEQGRVIYTGGYVLPGAIVGAGQTALPADLEQAAVEQVACWYQNRERLGLVRRWPKGGVY